MTEVVQLQPLVVRVRSALFEIAVREPTRPTRVVLWTIAGLFAVLVVWALVAKLDIVAVAQGRLVPETYVKIVQPAEAGVIREILVQEGDSVDKNQVLVRMDPTLNDVDRVATNRELELSQLQLRRVEAELVSRPLQRVANDDPLLFAQVHAQYQSHRQTFLDQVAQENAALDRVANELSAAREVLQKLEATLPSYERSAEAYGTLAKQNLVGAIQAEEKKREAIEKSQDLQSQRAQVAALIASLSQQEQRLAQLKSSYASDLNQQRVDMVSRITRLQQDSRKYTYQQGLLELRAPQAGIVKDLATTTVGAVVQPGTVLLNLVPASEPLQAQVMIDNQDIGFIREGQTVRIKLAAYPFQKYGMMDGVVKTVSADAEQHEERSADSDQAAQGLSFKAIVELEAQALNAVNQSFPLAAGMSVHAEIIQDQRTVLEYLLSPVQRVVSEAGRER